MQTSKIKIGEPYALREKGKVVRFKVRSIKTVTNRTSDKASPHDTTNTIHGVIEEADLPGTTLEERTLAVPPEDLLGHYTEYAELQKKQEEEQRIREEKRAAEEAVRLRLQAKLYEISGIQQPGTDPMKRYNEPIRVVHSGVDINGQEHCATLLAALEKLHG